MHEALTRKDFLCWSSVLLFLLTRFLILILEDYHESQIKLIEIQVSFGYVYKLKIQCAKKETKLK